MLLFRVFSGAFQPQWNPIAASNHQKIHRKISYNNFREPFQNNFYKMGRKGIKKTYTPNVFRKEVINRGLEACQGSQKSSAEPLSTHKVRARVKR